MEWQVLVGIGVDLVDVGRVESRAREDAGLLESLFTPAEIAYCSAKHRPAQHYAARLAAKEAFFKALGIDGKSGLAWREVEVMSGPSGRPELALHGSLAETARRREVKAIHVSLSHEGTMAVAQLVLES